MLFLYETPDRFFIARYCVKPLMMKEHDYG